MSETQQALFEKWAELKAQSGSPLVKWCVLAISVLTLWVWIIEPLQAWTNDLESQVDRNAGKASRLLALEKNADQWLKAREEARRALVESERALFASSSNTQSQANIQGYFRELAVSRNLNVESQKLAPPEPMPPLGFGLAIEMSMKGELIDVLYFLDDMSRSEKLISVDQWILQIERDKKAYVRFRATGIRPAETGTTR